jgi:sialate O-acetylesterase
MKKVILTTILAIVNLLFIPSVRAEVKLPAIVSSNMVLQRDTTVKLWGWADANEKITIKASWLKQTIAIQADDKGNWSCLVKTTLSKAPQTITIKDTSSDITLNNILFGEVWLCSGQSNMKRAMKGYNGQPTFGSLMATARSTNPNLRLFTVDIAGSKVPLNDVDKHIAWQQASPSSVLNFSAVAYYFGQQLQEILDVPVGLICTAYGGSAIKAWVSKEVMDSFKKVNLDGVDITKKTNKIPTVLFNAMIHPLTPYTIKGALWYQGEADRQEPEKYKKLFPAMVKDWR